ncbi:MAG: D-alanyl-D-alanine carboxypeptidase, partial [Treponema sp.]|nr:D-alanyl-D-alanine carboxypeptidase [Treponema sp.]
NYAEANSRNLKILLSALFCFFIVVFFAEPFFSPQVPPDFPDERLPPPQIGSRAAVVMDAATGTFVFLENPDKEIQPASLTKVMTMHIAFTEIAAGRACLDDIIVPPYESWAVNQPPRSSLMFLAGGQQVSLRELLLGLAVPSGNDAAVAVALHFAPSVADFADMMTQEAGAMGLEVTRFVEPSGISAYNMTTAREFAYFVRNYIRLWPESLMDFHAVRYFSFPRAEHLTDPDGRPRTITQRNSNTLLESTEGVDGLRTGFIYESGFNTSLTAERNGTRFIAVILGAPPTQQGRAIREADGRRLFEWAFSNYRTIRPNLEALPPARVWRAGENYAAVELSAPAEFTAPVERGEDMNWRIDAGAHLAAPLPAGSPAGSLVLYDSLGELRRIPLVTAGDVKEGGFFKRVFDSVRMLFARRPAG